MEGSNNGVMDIHQCKLFIDHRRVPGGVGCDEAVRIVRQVSISGGVGMAPATAVAISADVDAAPILQ